MALRCTISGARLLASAVAVAVALALALPATAQQQQDAPSRPGFLAAMGLLAPREATVRTDIAPAFTLELPESDDVVARERDTEGAGEDVLASWDFVTSDGRFVESLTVTVGSVDLADPETRRFAMANLLVLRSFPQLARQAPDARLLGFGPLVRDDALDAVQMVGSFTAPDEEAERPILFRHVGLLEEGREEVLIAIVNIDPSVLPVRNDDELLDTYAGRALDSLRLLSDADSAKQ